MKKGREWISPFSHGRKMEINTCVMFVLLSFPIFYLLFHFILFTKQNICNQPFRREIFFLSPFSRQPHYFRWYNALLSCSCVRPYLFTFLQTTFIFCRHLEKVWLGGSSSNEKSKYDMGRKCFFISCLHLMVNIFIFIFALMLVLLKEATTTRESVFHTISWGATRLSDSTCFSVNLYGRSLGQSILLSSSGYVCERAASTVSVEVSQSGALRVVR